MLISADTESNGLMETKLLRAETDDGSMSESIEGRIKAGIELSLNELNKLSSLWNGQPPLAPDKLNALRSNYFAQNNSTEFVKSIKLRGKNDERGLVWIIPTLQLNNVIINKVMKVDDSGQVVEVSEETISFPLPKSARILGIKST